MGVTLAGARVLLTGASGGIGHAIARRLAHEGSRLVLTGRRSEVLAALAGEIGADSVSIDLAERDGVDRALAGLGAFDVLVSNAALPGSGMLASLAQRDVDRALEVDLRAPIALARVLTPGMVSRGGGHVVFIGSLSGKAASAGSSVYNAAKFGLRGFALALRQELAGSGVGVSLVAPGFVSDAGMYADSGVVLPRGFSTRTPEQVAAAVVRAITRDRGEIAVASASMRLGADFANLAPEVAARAGRLVGADELARRFADGQAGKR